MKILSMSGFVPEQICDTVRFGGYSGERNISQYCGYAADFISQVQLDDSIDGAVFPKSCDSCRIIPSYLENCKKFLYQICVPSRQDTLAVEYFGAEIANYKKCLEEHFKYSIDDVPQRVEYINKRNADMKKLYEHLPELSYGQYLQMIHNMLQKPLLEQQVVEPAGRAFNSEKGKNVFVVGSFLSNHEIAATIEACGMNVVGDNLPESGRLVSQPKVNCAGNLYTSMAESLLWNRLSPTQNNFEEILKWDTLEIEERGVKGVIFISHKYCEPYDYLYSVYKKEMDARNIPVVHLKLTNSEDDRKVRLQLEAFADMI